jgi:hypothetical protein
MIYCGGGFEMREVGGFPPISDTPMGIDNAFFDVEDMADFVSHSCAYGTVIESRRSLRIEILEPCGGKVQPILDRYFSIRRLWIEIHNPFSATYRLTEASDKVVVVELPGSDRHA